MSADNIVLYFSIFVVAFVLIWAFVMIQIANIISITLKKFF